ncbi:DNA-binding transcriptional MerR regulator [Actinoplanes octamycinicus]|uniref:DNA-binding transcriptional MerR regulator n=1 Tax=Actinoplanes octamycinicus TaxID=135948 RepID=A0A7W7GZ93_9ACTN|nr:MerR family transcriptional regulator [Actinoplanes octamycinicus]MBB4741055.1 DNA-binding transcriptional MerR regulator [Actinoplanes octamycinicus]GIE55960.1 MerR family transcriptional regulator [Actinoplanes octamycinicus]
MPYTPGEVAGKIGVSIDTLRYYERIGLLHGIERTAGGQRVFSDDDLGRIGLLRCLRDSGMPIARLRRFAELLHDGPGAAEQRVELLAEHDREIDEKVAQLRAEQARVRDKIAWYRAETARLKEAR